MKNIYEEMGQIKKVFKIKNILLFNNKFAKDKK